MALAGTLRDNVTKQLATPQAAESNSSYDIAAASDNPSNGRQAVGPDQADESSKAIKQLTSVLTQPDEPSSQAISVVNTLSTKPADPVKPGAKDSKQRKRKESQETAAHKHNKRVMRASDAAAGANQCARRCSLCQQRTGPLRYSWNERAKHTTATHAPTIAYVPANMCVIIFRGCDSR